MRDLNRAQLQNEIHRRWGKRGWAEYRKDAARKDERDLIRTLCGGTEMMRRAGGRSMIIRVHSYPCQVGRIGPIFGFREILGQGDTWREAFAEVDRRIAADRERWAGDRATAASASAPRE